MSGFAGLGSMASTAISSAASQMAGTDKINFGAVLKDVVSAGLTNGMLDSSLMKNMGLSGTGASAIGRITGQAGVQGVVQQLTGGNFLDGLKQGALSGLAGEVSTQLNIEFDKIPDLSASERSMLNVLNRASASAIRALGNPNDPMAGFASDFLNSLIPQQKSDDPSAQSDDPLGDLIAGVEKQRAAAGAAGAGQEGAEDASQPATVRAGDYGGSMERIARAQLGPNATQSEINNYVGQLIEINGIDNPRTVQADWDIVLPDANTPAATDGLDVYGRDIAVEQQRARDIKVAQQAQDAQAAVGNDATASAGQSSSTPNSYVRVAGYPVNWADTLEPETGVTVWKPVGWGSSSFGHISTTINGMAYSFGPNGMTIEPIATYLERNNFRDGMEINLKLTNEQAKILTSCLTGLQETYNKLLNNCGTPIQKCLVNVGVNDFYQVGESSLGIDGRHVFPVDLGSGLLWSNAYKGVTEHPASKPSVGSNAPWAR
jgi:hypothetical protein